MWDFNPEENVKEKLKKFGDIKDPRGFRKFLRETMNASTGKTTYDLLGSVEIPLRVSNTGWGFENFLLEQIFMKLRIYEKSVFLFIFWISYQIIDIFN